MHLEGGKTSMATSLCQTSGVSGHLVAMEKQLKQLLLGHFFKFICENIFQACMLNTVTWHCIGKSGSISFGSQISQHLTLHSHEKPKAVFLSSEKERYSGRQAAENA